MGGRERERKKKREREKRKREGEGGEKRWDKETVRKREK